MGVVVRAMLRHFSCLPTPIMGCPHLFEIRELVLEVLEYCDIAQLAVFSTTCRYMAEMGERSMQGRVYRMLKQLLRDDSELTVSAGTQADMSR